MAQKLIIEYEETVDGVLENVKKTAHNSVSLWEIISVRALRGHKLGYINGFFLLTTRKREYHYRTDDK